MKDTLTELKSLPTLFFIATALLVCLLGCGQKNAEQDCVPASTDAPKGKKITRTQIRIDNPEAMQKANWCRSCILGPKGWASCQVAWDVKNKESREALEARARELACKDAGFEVGKCPPASKFNTRCKGDKAPKDSKTPGEALQDIFFKSKGRKPPQKPASEEPSPAEEKTNTPPPQSSTSAR